MIAKGIATLALLACREGISDVHGWRENETYLFADVDRRIKRANTGYVNSEFGEERKRKRNKTNVHRGLKKLRMKLNPAGQSYTGKRSLVNFPGASLREGSYSHN